MKKHLISAISCISVALLITFAVYATCWRGPRADEVEAFCLPFAKGKPMKVDSTEGDAGYFGVQIEGEEKFYIEATEQWVFPGRSYDWSR